MKVYAVMDDGNEAPVIVAVYATRELAEAALGAEHELWRRAWQREVDRAGQPIPRVGYRLRTGEGPNAGTTTVPQREEHPGTFEDWFRNRGGQWIEEWEVIDS